ncbi:MAG: hypothetical protein J6L91_00430 [Clostridia bacterium]|nr:hypothetical protein [Clostridia bacterium]
MGNTFASLHILNSDFDEVDCALSNYQFEGKKRLEKEGEALKEKLKSIEQKKSKFLQAAMLMDFLKKYKLPKAEFFCKEQGEFISVFSDFFQCENISDIAKEYFESFDCIVVAVAMTDNVFNLSIYKNGELLDSMAIGDGQDKCNLDGKHLSNQNGQNYLIKLEELNAVNNPEEAVDFFTSNINLQIDPKKVNLNDKSVRKYVY